jgi:hypothetical protein
VQSTCIPINSTTAFDFRFNAYAVAGQASARMETYADADCLTMLGAIGTQPDGPANDFVVHSLTNVALHTGARSARIVLAATPSPSGGRGDVLFDHIGFGPAGTLAAGININQEGLSGAWFNPLFGGQGLQFAISRDLATPGAGSLFGAWYTFDATAGGTDTQRWYSLEAFVGGDATSADVTIYQNIGGNFDAPPTTSAIAVGSGTLEFPSCVSATFDYVFDDGRTGTLSLQRLLANVECAETGTPGDATERFWSLGSVVRPRARRTGISHRRQSRQRTGFRRLVHVRGRWRSGRTSRAALVFGAGRLSCWEPVHGPAGLRIDGRYVRFRGHCFDRMDRHRDAHLHGLQQRRFRFRVRGG